MANDAWWRTSIAIALGDRERAMELLRETNPSWDDPRWLHTTYRLTTHQLEPLWDYPPFQELIRPKG